MIEKTEKVGAESGAQPDLLGRARGIAAEQAEDEGLWCIPQTAMEAHLQQELRRLTEAVEGKSAHQCAMDAIFGKGASILGQPGGKR